MNATSQATSCSVIGRRTLLTALFALLALAFAVQDGYAKPKMAGADVINQRVKNYTQACADMGGTSDEITVLGPNNTVESITATCTDSDGSELWGCEVAHTNIACRTAAVEPSQPAQVDGNLSLSPRDTPAQTPQGGVQSIGASDRSPAIATPAPADSGARSEIASDSNPSGDPIDDKP